MLLGLELQESNPEAAAGEAHRGGGTAAGVHQDPRGRRLQRGVHRARGADGAGHRRARGQHPEREEGQRRHQHRPGGGVLHLQDMRRGKRYQQSIY